jgi:hypothetical protein
MDRHRKNLWKSWIAVGLFGVAMPAISGFCDKEIEVSLSEQETCMKWGAVAIFLASCPLVLRIPKWISKDPPPDAP